MLRGGVPIQELNIGNIHNSEGKTQVTRSIFFGPEDKAAVKELSEVYHVQFNTKTTPSGNDGAAQVNVLDYI
ncbi:PTS sugar transporter subunit IIB [Streptococcus mitis]|nr:PTS sugar transporter subunit IIB [Streptococcus sp. NLN76]